MMSGGQAGKSACRPDKYHITLCFCTSGGEHAPSALTDRHLLLEALPPGRAHSSTGEQRHMAAAPTAENKLGIQAGSS